VLNAVLVGIDIALCLHYRSPSTRR
jgi:hypothetical protein